MINMLYNEDKKNFFCNGGVFMQSVKQEAIDIISKLPDTVAIDDIMYQLYVLSKVKKGQEQIKNGEFTTVENLRREIETW